MRSLLVAILLVAGDVACGNGSSAPPTAADSVAGFDAESYRWYAEDWKLDDCGAAYLTAAVKWHDPGGYVSTEASKDLLAGHPFIQPPGSGTFHCPADLSGDPVADQFGKTLQGSVWVDRDAICASLTNDDRCDVVEASRLTFVTARQLASAYCWRRYGNNECNLSKETAHCAHEQRAHTLMLVPLPDNGFSSWSACVDDPQFTTDEDQFRRLADRYRFGNVPTEVPSRPGVKWAQVACLYYLKTQSRVFQPACTR